MNFENPLPLRLRVLNLTRLIREYFISWGVLALIYSLTVTLILQPILEKALKTELPLVPLWITTALLLLIPGLLEALPAGGWSGGKRPFAMMGPGIFGERFWSQVGGPITPLYLRHELRRGATWITLALTVLCAGLLPQGKWALWVLVAQLPVQRALFSIHGWRGLARTHHPTSGAVQILRALWISQTLQALIAWACVGLCGYYTHSQWLMLGPAVMGGVLAAAGVAMEGDSGRPWLVGFFSLAAGTLGGYLCLWTPWCLLAVLYFCKQTQIMASSRLISVEHQDEDRLVS